MKFERNIILFSCIVLTLQCAIWSNNIDGEQKQIRAGFSSYLLKVIDNGDAHAALKLWAEELLNSFDNNYVLQTKIYDSKNKIIEDPMDIWI
jgi:hypothetical protein